MNTQKAVKTIRLPNELTIALGQYFLSYQLSKPQKIGSSYSNKIRTETFEDGIPFEKEKCLDRISNSLPKGWGYQACAGTFWVTSPRVKNHVYVIDNNKWPLAEILINKKKTN